MKLLKSLMLFFIVLVLTVLSCIFYAFKIEPYRITTNPYTLNSQADNAEKVKIVQISDLHIKEDFTYKNLDKVVNRVNMEEPDIIVFTGDLYDNYADYHDDEAIIAVLQKLKAKYSKIAVWGNRDYGGGAVRHYKQIIEGAGFILLKNENKNVTLENGKHILFTGLDDSILGEQHMPDSVHVSDSDYAVLLLHEPDMVDCYLNYDYDVILSGHSHGGQIDIPFIPAINKRAVAATSFSLRYSSGLNTLENHSILYVNTGIGTTHISARFGVVPEIAVFYLYL